MTAFIQAGLLAATFGAALWSGDFVGRRIQSRRKVAAKPAPPEPGAAQKADHDDRYRSLFESVPVAILVSRADGSLIDINSAGIAIFGYEGRNEALAVNMRHLYVNPANRKKRLAEALTSAGVEQGEYLMRRKNGTTFAALTKTQVIPKAGASPGHIETFVTDISEYKRLEADRRTLEHEQRISARLQSVGALAAGIAHEINTPMQFVSDSVYFLQTVINELKPLWPVLTPLTRHDIRPEDTGQTIPNLKIALAEIDVDHLVIDANDSAERALDGIRRITTIIRAMREFAHPDNGERSNVDINKAIETTLTVCKNVYKEVADVETDFGSLPLVLCQFGEINQVLLNIIVNAAHAIEAQNRDSGAKGLIRISTTTEDSWAVIRIADNGTGIPESVKARIFDPFFTTKEVGKGTGQGLAIVQSVIVERHRGRITVDSEVGKGTLFTLRLPISDPNLLFTGVDNEQA